MEDVAAEPPGHVFPPVLVGGTARADFRLRNINLSLTAVLDGLAVEALGGGASFFLDRGTCGATLAPGATCVLSVRFEPTSEGDKSGQVTVPSEGALRTRLWIELDGTALTNPTRLGDPCSPDLPCGAGTCQGGFCTRPCARYADCDEPNSEYRRGTCVVLAGAGRCVPACDRALRCYGVAEASCRLTTSTEGATASACSTDPLPPPPGGAGDAGGGS
jgi:hypothetical protein